MELECLKEVGGGGGRCDLFRGQSIVPADDWFRYRLGMECTEVRLENR